jgi:hypothetical protein
MMHRVLCIWLTFAFAAAAAPRNCIGSVDVATFQLSVVPPRTESSEGLPMRQVNNILSGYRINYKPLDLPGDLKKDAKLTLVMVPEAASHQVTVLQPQLAASRDEWTAPFAARIVVLVFAPQGLDEKRLTNLVTADSNLVAALADYADQTADVEAGIRAARQLQEEEDEQDSASVPAATPAERALFALVRALNPSVSSYNPLAGGRLAGPATLMGKGVDAFFENAGGFVPGGGILPAVKSWLLPDTEFRSVYGVPADPNGMTLCAQLQTKSRNKVAYLWAYRLSNSGPPSLAVSKDGDLPIGMRTSLPVKFDKSANWSLLNNVYDWTLVRDGGPTPPLRVSLQPVPEERALRLDLRKFPGPPGAYRIQGRWDWDSFQVKGDVRLHRLDDFKTAHPTPKSQDALITNTGVVPVELIGADFVFADHAWLHRPSSSRQIPVDFPAAPHSASSDRLQVGVDTDGLHPGPYMLALARIDGMVANIALQVLPPVPKLDTPGPRVNIGETDQHVIFTGTGLDRIERLECDAADITLDPSNEDGTRRGATIRLNNGAKAGDRPVLRATVKGMAEPVRYSKVLEVAGPRPRILDAKASFANDLTIMPQEGEIPADSWVSFALHVEPASTNASLTLQCADASRTVQPLKLHVGEKQVSAQLIASGADAWFLSLDPGAAGQSGCTLTAVMDVEDLGKSDPFPLGKIIRLPRIESFAMTDEKSTKGFYGTLTGFDLETIAKTGWDAQNGVAVAELPRPVVGEGSKQTLRISMPWPSPSPKAPLFVWLRGEDQGRATKVQP